jgi:hypothetical protein
MRKSIMKQTLSSLTFVCLTLSAVHAAKTPEYLYILEDGRLSERLNGFLAGP